MTPPRLMTLVLPSTPSANPYPPVVPARPCPSLPQHTLDHLLGCACIPEGLALFKSLCRYYYTLNPAATAEYVGIYREMWDSENAEEAKA